MSDRHISDEMLNAFIDEELSAEDRETIYDAMTMDASLSRRLCELRNIHDLSRMAYSHLPEPPSGRARHNPVQVRRVLRPWVMTMAATLVLGLGVLIGWTMRPETTTAPLAYNQTPLWTNTTTQLAAPANNGVTSTKEMRILFHLSSHDTSKAREALNEIENLLEHYRRKDQKVQVELVTNGTGIDLLRIKTSPFPARISAMQQKYDNLSFVVCQNSITRARQRYHATIKLLPGTVVIDSGVAQIMRRQRQGWAYIQV